MKSLLLLTDFSSNSMNAIDYALNLFKKQHCNFYVLNVQKASSFISDDLFASNATSNVYRALIGSAKMAVDDIIHKLELKHSNSNHHFFSLVDYDNFIDAIHQVVKTYSIDLIVLGNKETSGLEKMFFGSNTIRALRHCDTPILVVPYSCEFTGMDEVAFLASQISPSNQKALSVLNYILNQYNSNLTLLLPIDIDYQSDKLIENISFFDSNFEDVKHEYIDISVNEIVKSIKQFVNNSNLKMLVMLKKQHSFLERLVDTYPEEKIIHAFDIPFLVLSNSELLSD